MSVSRRSSSRIKISLFSILGIVLIFTILMMPNTISPIITVKATWATPIYINDAIIYNVTLKGINNNVLANFSSINDSALISVGTMISSIIVECDVTLTTPINDSIPFNISAYDFMLWVWLTGEISTPQNVITVLNPGIYLHYMQGLRGYANTFTLVFKFSNVNYQINTNGDFNINITMSFLRE